MAQKGDTFKIKLKKAHLEWGTHRKTNTRERIYGEGYIPIPSEIARKFRLLNSNGTNGADVLGENIFNCRSSEGYFDGILKSQGASRSGDIFAKQFSADGNLKELGSWFEKVKAIEGDEIQITWSSPTDLIIEKI